MGTRQSSVHVPLSSIAPPPFLSGTHTRMLPHQPPLLARTHASTLVRRAGGDALLTLRECDEPHLLLHHLDICVIITIRNCIRDASRGPP